MKRIAKLVGLVWHLTQMRQLNIPDLSGFRWISWQQASKNCKWGNRRILRIHKSYWPIQRSKKSRSLQPHGMPAIFWLASELGPDQNSSWRHDRPWFFPSSQPVTGIMATCAPEFTKSTVSPSFNASMFPVPNLDQEKLFDVPGGKMMTLCSYAWWPVKIYESMNQNETPGWETKDDKSIQASNEPGKLGSASTAASHSRKGLQNPKIEMPHLTRKATSPCLLLSGSTRDVQDGIEGFIGKMWPLM